LTDREDAAGPPSGESADNASFLVGRKLADRRVRATPFSSPYFRHAGPGMFTARPAAVEPSLPLERMTWRLRRALFGRVLATDEELGERLSKVKALATFSSDNLSSVAYATELIMFSLLAAGSAAFWLVLPVSGLIVAIFLVIVITRRIATTLSGTRQSSKAPGKADRMAATPAATLTETVST